MDEFEKKLSQLGFQEPPKWLKARAFVAAQNQLLRQHRKKKIKTLLWVAIAAGLALAMLGQYIANAIAPLVGPKTSPVRAAPIQPIPFLPGQLFEPDGFRVDSGSFQRPIDLFPDLTTRTLGG